MKTTACPCCGTIISATLVNNQRRWVDAMSISDKNERAKALARLNGETIVCPRARTRNGGGA